MRLSKWELRYEPFWHLVARREVDYLHEAVYPVQITNPYARKVEIAGTAFEILPDSGTSRASTCSCRNSATARSMW